MIYSENNQHATLTLEDNEEDLRFRRASCKAPPSPPNIETPPTGRFLPLSVGCLVEAATKKAVVARIYYKTISPQIDVMSGNVSENPVFYEEILKSFCTQSAQYIIRVYGI